MSVTTCEKEFVLNVTGGWEAKLDLTFFVGPPAILLVPGNWLTWDPVTGNPLTWGCDWPADIKALHPAMCNQDQGMWPSKAWPALMAGTSFTLGSSVTMVFGHGRWNDVNYSTPDQSLYDLVVLRKRVEGGATGKNCSISMNYTYPGGSFTRHPLGVPEAVTAVLDMETFQLPWSNGLGFFNLFLFPSPSTLNISQIAPTSGTWVQNLTVAAGQTDYICASVGVIPYDCSGLKVILSSTEVPI